MTTLTATAETLKAALAALRDGDTLKLSGAFPPYRAANLIFANGVVIDATEAEITEWYWSNIEGVRFIGGTWLGGSTTDTSALRIDRARRVSMLAGKYIGATRLGRIPDGYGVKILGGAYTPPDLALGTPAKWVENDVRIEEGIFEGMKVGVALNKVKGVLVSKGAFRGARSDGINFGQCWDFEASGNDIRETKITADEHPDGIQIWSNPDAPPSSDGVIRGNIIDGMMQGIGLFNHTRERPAGYRLHTGEVLAEPRILNDGGADRITVDGNQVNVGYPHGITLGEVRSPVVTDNKVTTCEGAFYQANINLPGCTDVTRFGNTVAAWGGKPAKDDPPVLTSPPALPPEPVDPQIAEIEALRAQVAALTTDNDSLADRLAEAALLASELRASKDALEARVGRLLEERARALALAKQARAARAKNQYLDQLIALLSAPSP